MKEYTLSELFAEFGTEKQNNMLIEGNGNVNKRTFDSVIKKAGSKYEPNSITVKGRGKDRIITCAEARKETVEMSEIYNYQNCGQGQMVYGYELHNLVLNYALNHCRNKMKSMSVNQWLLELGLITENFKLATWNVGLRDEHLEKLQEKYNSKKNKVVNDKTLYVIDDLIFQESNRLKRSLISVLERLADKKITIYKKSMAGCYTEEDENGKTRDIHTELPDMYISLIANIKRELSAKHDVSLEDVARRRRNKKVYAYNYEFKQRINDLGFNYVYETHGFVVQASDKQIKKFIERLNNKGQLQYEYRLTNEGITAMIRDFKRIYSENAMDLARDRQDKCLGRGALLDFKVKERYVPMYKLILEFYRLTNIDIEKVIA